MGNALFFFSIHILIGSATVLKTVKKYVSSAGIPLVEKVNERPVNSSLEERVQILETLLQDYYLDDYYLKKVKYVRINHKRFLKKYEEINRQDNEDTENTESTELFNDCSI